MVKQGSRDSDAPKLIEQGQVAYGGAEIPCKALGKFRPDVSRFPANLRPELHKILSETIPNLALNPKAKSTFGMQPPEGVDGSQIALGKLLDIGKINPFTLKCGFSG
jgi:hypothetical protein